MQLDAIIMNISASNVINVIVIGVRREYAPPPPQSEKTLGQSINHRLWKVQDSMFNYPISQNTSGVHTVACTAKTA